MWHRVPSTRPLGVILYLHLDGSRFTTPTSRSRSRSSDWMPKQDASTLLTDLIWTALITSSLGLAILSVCHSSPTCKIGSRARIEDCQEYGSTRGTLKTHP